MGKLTKSKIGALKTLTVEYIVWDDDIPGYGVRVYPSGKKTFFVQYRLGRRTRRLKLGGTSILTADQARNAAKKALGMLANGSDPASDRYALRNDITVSKLCDLYLTEGCTIKKPATLATDRGRITRHIKPLLGGRSVRDVKHSDIERFLNDVAAGKTAVDIKTKPHGRARVKGGRGTATRTVGLLGAIFSYAQRRQIRPDNPVRGIKRFKDRKMERFLSIDELTRLGFALSAAEVEGENKHALAAIYLLAVTGCRRSEVLTLKWGNIDWTAKCLVLPDSKTGHKIVPVGEAVLEKLRTLVPADGYVFPGNKPNKPFEGIQKVWVRVRARAGLSNVRLHDLRHTFISAGINNGLSLAVMGRIAGHKNTETTARYAHLVASSINIAADRVSSLVASALVSNNANVSPGTLDT
jgi:integrase